MKLKLYQIDAFTDKLFAGNPAAVVPLKKWLPDELMQKLAMENNLAETVFFVPSSVKGVDYDIRWFTPAVEINLCGHATLASAFTIFTIFFSNSNFLFIQLLSYIFEETENLQKKKNKNINKFFTDC